MSDDEKLEVISDLKYLSYIIIKDYMEEEDFVELKRLYEDLHENLKDIKNLVEEVNAGLTEEQLNTTRRKARKMQLTHLHEVFTEIMRILI